MSDKPPDPDASPSPTSDGPSTTAAAPDDIGSHSDAHVDALLDALAYDIAIDEAERGISSDSDDWATDVDAILREQLAVMQRSLTPRDVKVRRMKPISPALLIMARDVLIAMVDDLRSSGSLRYAHRELSILSDDDLRRLIELQRIDPQDLE